MRDKCIKKVIEYYFKDVPVKDALEKVKAECNCGKCNLNCGGECHKEDRYYPGADEFMGNTTTGDSKGAE